MDLPEGDNPDIQYRAMVTVIVGEKRVRFQIPERLIFEKSEFFKLALRGDKWQEGQSKIVVLEEDDPMVFGMYLKWLYTSRVKISVDIDDEFDLEPIVALYSFADKIACRSCKKAIARKFYTTIMCSNCQGVSSPEAFEMMTWGPDGFSAMIMDWFWSISDTDYVDETFVSAKPIFTASVLRHIISKLVDVRSDWQQYRMDKSSPTVDLDRLGDFHDLDEYLDKIV